MTFCSALLGLVLVLTSSVAGAQNAPGQSSPDAARQQEYYRITRQARQLQNNGDLEKALSLWEAADALQPGSYSTYNGIRRCLLDMNRYDDALDFTDRMMILARSGKAQLDPRRVAADRVEVVFAAQGDSAGNACLEKVMRDFKGNPEIYQDLSGVLSMLRKSDEAMDLLLRGRRECGDPYLFARDLARWHESRMNWEAAVEEYLLYLRKDPINLTYVTGSLADMSSVSHVDSLMVGILNGRINHARGEDRQQIRKLLATLHFRAKRYAAALEQYKNIERDSREQGRELLEFARMTADEGEYRLSWEAYHEILTANPGIKLKTRALAGIGQAAQALGELDSAETAYQAALEPGVDPEIAYLSYSRQGQIAFESRLNPGRARDLFQKAAQIAAIGNVAVDPNLNIELQIALTYQFEGNFKETEIQLKNLIRRSARGRSGAADTRFELARLYFRQGELDKAQAELVALSVGDPSSAAANDALSLKVMMQDLKDNPGSLKCLGQADLFQFKKDFTAAVKCLDSLQADSEGLAVEYALWKLYEVHKGARQLQAALVDLQRLIERRNALRRDEALMHAGDLCSRALHETDKAAHYFEQVLIDYPLSPLADQARRRLKELAVETS